MNATDILREEHRVIRRVLYALPLATRQLKKGRKLPHRFLVDSLEFMENYVDNYHCRRDEILINALYRSSIPKTDYYLYLYNLEESLVREPVEPIEIEVLKDPLGMMKFEDRILSGRRGGGVCSLLMAQHDIAHAIVHIMHSAVEKAESGEQSALDDVIFVTELYVAHKENHMIFESQELFPRVDNLPSSETDNLQKDLDEVVTSLETGVIVSSVQKTYSGMAEMLEREAKAKHR